MVILKSNNCPKCVVLESKLNEKGVEFEKNSDFSDIMEKGFRTAPVLIVNEEYMDFAKAITWVNNYGEAV